ncbi:DUF2637 domain-containing protein [Streptomyces sp. CA-256286]|uniref:DUF2637 domain-containing protein n=1 Tax=Streptomyces TaxID=1883 RepID=UPI001A99F490|nr:hypothetical protein JHY03_38560 [Streptomyces sp. CA-256286]
MSLPALTSHRTPDPDPHRPQLAKHTAERYALIAAGVVIVALTAAGFWLSYAHLAEVAGQHGLGGSPIRQWAWPATLDAFIVAGELLMLRAGLRAVTDGWAIVLTAAGSVGSIALNVAGVSGSGHPGPVPVLDYVVAAVPPTAALLAFAVLMRQIHQLVDRTDSDAEEEPTPLLEALAAPVGQHLELPATTSAQRAEEQPQASGGSRSGRPAGATLEELVEIGRAAAADEGRLTRDSVQRAVRARGLTVGGQRLTEVMNTLRAEHATAHSTGPKSD